MKMAIKRSWAYVKRAAEPTTFAGKYGLKRVAGLTDVGKECFVIPLDMANGYSCLPYHTLRKNDSEGFKGSSFDSVKITCKRYDPETGEASKELPLCCKLAQLEKDRLSEPDDASKRALNFTSFRYVFPVLVLSTTEDNPKKKPSLKKLSLNGIGFSYLDLAESSYEEELKNKIIEDLVKAEIIEDPEEMDQEELMQRVAEYISHSIIKVANVEAKSPRIPYQKAFSVTPVTHSLVGADSGEAGAIRVLCKLLAGDYKPEQYDKIYAKYPVLQEINNQVIDFLQLYDDSVDSLVEDWTEDELQKYYNGFLNKQEQIEAYKKVNEANVDTDEEIEFVSNAKSISAVEEAEDPDSVSDDEDFDVDIDDSIDDGEDFEEEVTPAPKAAKTAKKAAPAKVAVAVGSISEDDFNMDDLESDTGLDEVDSIMGDDEFDEDEGSFEEDFS